MLEVTAAEDEVEARVHPTLVPEDHLLASVRNEFNAVYVQSDIADATLYYGRGAGRLPTASAVVADVVESRILMRPLSDREIDAYVASGEADGKAGAYAIQGRGGLLVEDIQGSPHTVVGLPIHRLPELFSHHDVDFLSMLTSRS